LILLQKVVYGDKMKEIIDVNTGEVRLGRGKIILRSIAIGSCIVVAACDFKKNIGALAHIMLPGKAAKSTPERTRYAADAIDEMLNRMTEAGANKDNIDVCLVGGVNVLKKQNDTICEDNIRSATQLLEERHIPIRAAVLGGTRRKGVFLDVENGCISYTEGDEKEKPLWKSGKETALR
jgi:chemotaxis protein CheD